ncbi:hypothetical protein C8F04DRAFT_1353694 [Mycena alexandri]|uniref:Alpha-type protein kinase domain-containing protein n=1 Tax=Mycena alexandri TaxID=1745969 RepID=A0AAD6SXD9_9AGAR|nr:hypothetical protein C8F04DRAFT_1353694 [Mycena alexandri]
MHPKICPALNDCSIDWKCIVLREISDWVNLCQEPPHKTYFYHRCLTGKLTGKDGVITFKKPTKAFELALVIDAEQSEEICQYLAQKDSGRTDSIDHSDSDDEYHPGPVPRGYGLNTARFDTRQKGLSSSLRRQSMLVSESSKRQRSPSVPRTPPQSKRLNFSELPTYKFINNGSAVPLPLMNESVSALAEFLSFTQHVQYHKTKALIYCSDLQGEIAFSIMTAPSIGEGVEIWGEGNVAAAFNAFPEQHVCNKFCTWFQLLSDTIAAKAAFSEFDSALAQTLRRLAAGSCDRVACQIRWLWFIKQNMWGPANKFTDLMINSLKSRVTHYTAYVWYGAVAWVRLPDKAITGHQTSVVLWLSIVPAYKYYTGIRTLPAGSADISAY